jgi:hypothetical protein
VGGDGGNLNAVGRSLRWLLAVPLLLPILPACGTGGSCPELPILTKVEAAADEATSCIVAFEFEERIYSDWCLPVRAALIEESPQLTSEDGQDVARFILGVEPRRAIAVAAGGDCGRWSFAPSELLSAANARALARRVAVPGSVHRGRATVPTDGSPA